MNHKHVEMVVFDWAGTTNRLLEPAAAEGYAPDLSFCPDDAPGGRPYPWMCFRLAIELKVTALWRAVKIGDMESDVEEGINAGMWTVGLTRSGNGVGRSLAAWQALEPAAQRAALTQSEAPLRAAGAHYILESAADCLPVIEEIAERISCGERP